MLTKELIKKLRKLEIFTRRLVNDQLAGQYHSVFKGRGMNFDEVRLYQPGDDIRHIDWNVSARTAADEVYIKTYVEERELTVFVVFDASASTLFGSVAERKREVAAEVAALVAFSAIKNNDRVGLVIFTGEVELFIPPQKGRKHVMRIIAEVLNYQPKGKGTDVEGAIEFLNLVNRRKTVAFLISDFLDEGFERALSMSARRHDLIPVVITDPMEEELPDMGVCYFEDVETGQWLSVDTSSRGVRERYRQQAIDRKALRDKMFQRSKLDSVAVYTHQPYIQPLVGFFRRRAKRH
jgi:uncharacterized protein (DUF58 family)